MERRKWKWDHTGYLVLDVREDDFSDLYEISRDGEIHPRAGEGHGRASWNISLLKLDLKKYEKSRALNLDFFQQAEEILRLLSDPDHERSHAAFAGVLAPLVQYLARHRAFFLAFDLVMSPELQARVDAEAREAVEHLLTAVGVASASA